MKPDHSPPLAGVIAQHPAIKPLSLLALAAALSACAQPSALERSLGESVRQARQQQAVAMPSVRPSAGPDGQPILTDGVIAAQGVTRYQQSWVNPPAPITVLNVQTGAAGAASAMPR